MLSVKTMIFQDQQSTVNDYQNLSFDCLKYVMTDHSDQQLLV